MAIGDRGHRGMPVVSLVTEAFSFGSACATTRRQTLVAKSALVTPKTANCATKKLAQLVRHVDFLICYHAIPPLLACIRYDLYLSRTFARTAISAEVAKVLTFCI